MLGGEIDNDAEAEGDRQPGQQPAGRHFGNCPLPQQLAGAASGGAEQLGRNAGAATRGIRLRSPGFGTRAAALAGWTKIGHAQRPRYAQRGVSDGPILGCPKVVPRRTDVNAH